jgi:hypothetical protein
MPQRFPLVRRPLLSIPAAFVLLWLVTVVGFYLRDRFRAQSGPRSQPSSIAPILAR